MTTTIVFGDASDGVVVSSHGTYSNARAGAGLSTNTTGVALTIDGSTGGLSFGIGQVLFSSSYFCAEGFIAFDLDAADIPSGDAVTDADLALNQASAAATTDPFTIEARAHDWGASLGTTDWVSGADLATLDLLATWAYASGTGLRTFTPSGSALIDHVEANRAGVSRILLNSSRHRLGNTPTGGEYAVFSSANATGTTNDPRLIIEHEEAAPPEGSILEVFDGDTWQPLALEVFDGDTWAPLSLEAVP